jgi:hypothetical protein
VSQDPRDAQELLNSQRGVFIICKAINILRQIAEAAGQGDKVPPDDDIVARVFPGDGERVVLDDGSATLVAAALLWGSRTLEEQGNPQHGDIADMRLLLTLLRKHLPADHFHWSDLPTGGRQ